MWQRVLDRADVCTSPDTSVATSVIMQLDRRACMYENNAHASFTDANDSGKSPDYISSVSLTSVFFLLSSPLCQIITSSPPPVMISSSAPATGY